MDTKTNILDELFDEVVNSKEHKRTKQKMLLASKIDMGIKAKKWNKTKFAKKMNQNSTSVITRWLSGTHNFTSDTLSDIEDVLGIKLLNTETENTISTVSYSVKSPRIQQNMDLALMYQNSIIMQPNSKFTE